MAMTKDEFQSACKRHGYTVTEFAEEFGVAPSTAYQWGARYGVPRWATRVLGLMDQHGAAALGGSGPRKPTPPQPPTQAAFPLPPL